MATALDRDIRRLLDRAVRRARIVAEDGARKALIALGVEDARRPTGLSQAQIELRNRLRAHAQSLGDSKAPNASIKANRLVREIAYGHWHRALFARFLAENNLLIDPEHKVAVSFAELEQIAKEEGRDLVEMAADWAEPMLPQIFRKDDPVLALALPPESKVGITEIVKGLPRAVFMADDALGWVYQFWQADDKDAINRSEVKIGADELPAVTQLFTEDYMVLFLLENTLGAWWAGKVLAADPALAAGAESERELRAKTSLLGYRWTYLRFVRQRLDGEKHATATGPWHPAAGAFEGWPEAARAITVLDPCAGSGHFLVFALPILVAFRRAEEDLDERAAVKAVLAENLYGLEIDPRCAQIAAFALALASWKRLGRPEPLPRLNLACCGLAMGLGKPEFLKLAEKIAHAEGWAAKRAPSGTQRAPLGGRAAARIRGGLERLHELFAKAPSLGSLIDPRRAVSGGGGGYGCLFEDTFEMLSDLLQRVLDTGEADAEARELAVTAQGVAKATELLACQYVLVVTNVPFLGTIRQDDIFGAAVADLFEVEHADLATAMIERSLRLSGTNGCIAIVSPEAWLMQPSYEKFRAYLIPRVAFKAVVKLGAGAFEEITGEVVKASLTICANDREPSATPCWNATAVASALGKSETVREDAPFSKDRDALVGAGSFRIVVDQLESDLTLGEHIFVSQGLKSGDDSYFVRCFWEGSPRGGSWQPVLSVPDGRSLFSGRTSLVRYGNGQGIARDQGKKAWGTLGVGIGQMSSLPACIYMGEVFDSNVAACSLKSRDISAALIAYARSGALQENLRKIDSKMGVNNGSFLDVEFDLPYWERIGAEQFPNGIPKPYSNDPTQWLFDGHPRGSADPNVARDGAANPRLVTPHGVRPGLSEHPLQVAVARLLGYRWPRQTGSSFMDCPAIAEPDEVDRCDVVDTAGIVPLPALADEADAATRLRALIRAVWGPNYGEGTMRELLAAEGAGASDLPTWLADEFFDGHCRLFHHTPFVWQVWDGLRGGFSALVNYHRLCEGNGAGRRLLEKLRDTYLGEWIAVQRRAHAAGEAGAEERLMAAEHLRGELAKIIDGDPPYDVFVRWKPLYRQPIGWEPDIDDGVRLNIRPFLTAKPSKPGRKDACILRVTPRVKKHAGADRGAEAKGERDDFPWLFAEDSDVGAQDFPGGARFKGRRYNDFHYTRAFKQRARDGRSKK